MNESTTNGELQRDLGRVEGKIDGILAGILSIQVENTSCNADRAHIAERVNKVENRQYWFSGVGAALGFAIAKLTSHLPLF